MDNTYSVSYEVISKDFTRSGDASRTIKKTLHHMGIDSKIIRRVAIATYEAEMNLAIHSVGGTIIFIVSDDAIEIRSNDYGPGIQDVKQAMVEGYSTATNEIREMGFGAGMGLSNMQSCADVFNIKSKVDQGTNIKMTFNLKVI